MCGHCAAVAGPAALRAGPCGIPSGGCTARFGGPSEHGAPVSAASSGRDRGCQEEAAAAPGRHSPSVEGVGREAQLQGARVAARLQRLLPAGPGVHGHRGHHGSVPLRSGAHCGPLGGCCLTARWRLAGNDATSASRSLRPLWPESLVPQLSATAWPAAFSQAPTKKRQSSLRIEASFRVRPNKNW